MFSFITANSPTIKRIEFVGNYSLKDWSKYLKTKPGMILDSTTLTADFNLIQQRYAAGGFLWAEIRYRIINQPGGVILRWEIKENQPAQIGTIHISGNEKIDSASLTERLKFTNTVFTLKTVEDNIIALLNLYLDAGFPYCRIEPKDFQITNAKVCYTLQVNEGPKVIIKDIKFTNPVITKPTVLKRIFGLGSNWVYSETKIKAGIRRLEKTKLFTVLKHEVKQENEDFLLAIALSEKKSNEFQAAMAFLPKTSDRPVEYAGFAWLDIKNLFGTMRQLKATWTKNPTRTIYALRYTEPLLFGTAMNLGGEVNHETKDTTYAKTSFNLFSDITIQDILTLYFETGYELLIPGISDLYRSETYWLGSGIIFDNLDIPLNPQQGIYAQLINRLGRKTTKYQQSQLLAKTYFDSEIIFPATNKFNFAFLFHGRNLYQSDTVDSYEIFYLGGAQSLRGYQEEAFAAFRLGWLNSEFRWRLGETSRIFPFLDIGVYQEAHNYKIKAGYGFGLRVESKIGLFGLDYGLALRTSWLNGKIHLSFANQF